VSILDRLPSRKPYARATTDRELIVQRPYRRDGAELSAIERLRERDLLYHLAEETARTDPWTAATRLFGGTR
jgi:hypothetical protein